MTAAVGCVWGCVWDCVWFALGMGISRVLAAFGREVRLRLELRLVCVCVWLRLELRLRFAPAFGLRLLRLSKRLGICV